MSELKGQLLGIILVILVFGGVAAILANTFVNTANKVNDDTESAFDNAGDIISSNLPNSSPLMTYYETI